MKYDKLPLEDHVLRYGAYNRLHRDPDTDQPIALSHQAFNLRPEDERQLSVTWVQYFEGDEVASLTSAVQAFRASMSKPLTSKVKGAFGRAEVGQIIEVFRRYSQPRKVRILHDPTPENPAHSVVTNFEDQHKDLLDILALSVFSHLIPNGDISD